MAVGNMLRVLKGNQETLISPANKDEYLKKGYSVIDEDGSILEQGVKSERTVRNELEAAKKRIAELELELRGYKEADSAESEAETKKGRKGKEQSLSD